MRVPVKLLGFVFWLFSLNCGQCEECIREDITYENTDPVAKASYDDGETVKVNCMSGFTGMYRLKCEKGKWTTTTERPCAKKKCSHPGDTTNGDFKLIGGSEFVFGVTVLYTCKKGFEMTSRINQRTCRAQGWDNTLPVCEAVKCPAIRTDVGVTASGNTEEGSYGDVIQFECVSSDKKLDGSSDIHCTETGDWSDSVPTCKEITCTAPDIPNGNVVERVQEYQKDAILKYTCDKGFKPREGIPRCAKFGWTMNPECDEVTCELKSTFGVEKFNPAGKTIFRAGEKVEITCSEKYWVFFTKEAIKSFSCRENGEWDNNPVCEEIICEVPRDHHVSYLEHSYFEKIKLGAKRSYYCISGYNQMAAEATCTRDGWTPKPLCAEIMCAVPDIPNAKIVEGQRSNYRISSRIKYKCNTGFEPEEPVRITCNSQGEWTDIQKCTAKQKLCPDLSMKNELIYSHSYNEEEIFYSCNTGYKPFTGNWWDSVTCSKGSWTEEPRCIREEECGAFPRVHHGKLKQTKNTFRDGETTAFECDPGFTPTQSFIKCVSGSWDTPVCEVGVTCNIPPKVENALITSKPEELYVDGSSVTYACRRSFLMNGNSTVSCRNGTWEETPTCKEIRCEVPRDHHVPNPEHYFYGEMKLGAKRSYYCLPDQMAAEATCTRDGWTPKPLCAVQMCAAPDIPNAKIVEGQRSDYRISSRIKYKCNTGFDPEEPVRITCNSQGEWTDIQQCTDLNNFKCEVPRDQLVFRPETYFVGEMKLGAKITYYCLSDGKEAEHEATCTRDGWTPKPLCAGQ